jgi:predicted pyridoxine 5'-phosphate oxidase superfamily flavin-nucleotide-binding protein
VRRARSAGTLGAKRTSSAGGGEAASIARSSRTRLVNAEVSAPRGSRTASTASRRVFGGVGVGARTSSRADGRPSWTCWRGCYDPLGDRDGAPNIALAKYWGKQQARRERPTRRRPFSVTLSGMSARLTVSFDDTLVRR